MPQDQCVIIFSNEWNKSNPSQERIHSNSHISTTLKMFILQKHREILTYLISCSGSSGSFSGGRSRNNHKSLSEDHPSSFHCNCFKCYTSYWVRWDSSPNRQH
uniref:Uncharacterized protein n=1 Tax=Nelumbo nucifera TaxID=4432 RepID=A0A822YVM4_NELNU|nr:TPA_asm: hypothetical protein HUJ06_006803 [Nelumbo nucifera]